MSWHISSEAPDLILAYPVSVRPSGRQLVDPRGQSGSPRLGLEQAVQDEAGNEDISRGRRGCPGWLSVPLL